LGVEYKPAPEKLIIHPDKPLCGGAMYSPGYWPRTYLCKDQPIIAEIGKQYGFDPMRTPWQEMSAEAQQAFLYGDGLEYTWTYISKGGRRKGQEHTSTWTWHGFYGEDSWIFDWDVQGTYTRKLTCPQCNGAGLRPEYLSVSLLGKNFYELNEMPLAKVESLVSKITLSGKGDALIATSYQAVKKRLRFLRQVGIGYLHLNRPSGTLSAGEAQRIQLASLLGSELRGLTILVDEPSRGMHPSELESLLVALQELRAEGNTVIVVEHDPVLMRAADHIIDMGPGAGASGGHVMAQGSPSEIIESGTPTGKWLRTVKVTQDVKRRAPADWMQINGARSNNLQGEDVTIPLGTLCGICGVSGSGKSTLVIDTLGRALVKKTHSSSFSREPIEPGEHDTIENAPARALLVDQSRRGVQSPAKFLGLEKLLLQIYADSDDARAFGLNGKDLSRRCSSCRGVGLIRIQMGFLPDEWVECETCRATGYSHEAWEVRIRGVSLPEINAMTIDEVFQHFENEDKLAPRLEIIRQVGLGYLVWKQPAYALSGGEVQRLKIAKELIKKSRKGTLYILDEPTVGLHLDDVARLVDVLNQLVNAGHSVVAVEHHPHLLAACDWLIELGPGGGPEGGAIIAAGTPETLAQHKTVTAPYIRELLE
jgi:excinuclease ABC subunit A